MTDCMGWCAGDSGASAIKTAFEEVVAPAAHRFAPDIILVRYSKPKSKVGYQHCVDWKLVLLALEYFDSQSLHCVACNAGTLCVLMLCGIRMYVIFC